MNWGKHMLGYILGTWFIGVALGGSAVVFGPNPYSDPVLGIMVGAGLGIVLIALQAFRNWQRREVGEAEWRGAHQARQPVSTSLTLRGE